MLGERSLGGENGGMSFSWRCSPFCVASGSRAAWLQVADAILLPAGVGAVCKFGRRYRSMSGLVGNEQSAVFPVTTEAGGAVNAGLALHYVAGKSPQARSSASSPHPSALRPRPCSVCLINGLIVCVL